MRLTYLAQPYSHPDENTRTDRYTDAMEYIAWSFKNRPAIVVYSPIVHHHPLASLFDLPTEAAPWRTRNHEMLRRSNQMEILNLAGARDSVGLKDEIGRAIVYQTPIYLITPNGGSYDIAEASSQKLVTQLR